MTDDSPVSIAERYTVATGARSLVMRERGSGQVDVLIAAGWAGDGIGVSLMRLRAEFDAAMSSVRGTANGSPTERGLALMQVRSLTGVKAKLGEMARRQATSSGFRGTERDVNHITGRCLDVFLSPTCPACEGRGFNGGGRHEQTGAPVLCVPCKGTGRRDQAIGRNAAEREFARHMLALMDKATGMAAARLKEKLR